MNHITGYNFFRQLTKLSFVEEIWLFGSRARGDNNDRSDIDLSITCTNPAQEEWHQVLDIVNNADTLLKIDCINFLELKESNKLKQNILNSRKPLYLKNKGVVMFSKDRLESLGDALKRLKELLERPDVDSIDYLRDAVIHRFEFTVELYWKVLKMILAYEKIESNTPRDVLSKAFQFRLIDNEKIWLAMLDDRNSTSHVYNEEDARKVFLRIKTYTPLLESTYVKLQDKYS